MEGKVDDSADRLRKRRLDDTGDRHDDVRDPFERDLGRLTHALCFRRLQGKSQVFGVGAGDPYRTRLTHSLEVAQIGRAISRRLVREDDSLSNHTDPGLRMNPDVVECAALAHDLGHPAFGHKGEDVLDELLRNEGYRFEGNAQTFHLLMFLEKGVERSTYGNLVVSNGLNLTSAVLLATNKYPSSLGPEGSGQIEELARQAEQHALAKKGLYPGEWAQIEQLRNHWNMPPKATTLEAQLMDLCDDIAYSAHDLEDGIRARKIELAALEPGHPRSPLLLKSVTEEVARDQVNNPEVWPSGTDLQARVSEVISALHKQWSRIRIELRGTPRARRELKAQLVNRFANAVGLLDMPVGWRKVTFVSGGEENRQLRQEMTVLKKLCWVSLVNDTRVQRLQYRSERVLRGLWEAFTDDWYHYLPHDWSERFVEIQQSTSGMWSESRLKADYIANMTDTYAERVYQELFGGSPPGNIYEVE